MYDEVLVVAEPMSFAYISQDEVKFVTKESYIKWTLYAP